MADITVAADPNPGAFDNGLDRIGPVWTDFRTGYLFYVNNAGPNKIVYTKTVDGGDNWAATVNVSLGTPDTGEAIGVWYDRWTPGDTGTLIHIAFADDNVGRDVVWRSLDTATDTLSGQVVVIAGGGSASAFQIAITKARDGNLYIGWHSNDANISSDWRRSTTAGATWADPGDNPMESPTDSALFLPASNTGDDQDIWIIFHDNNDNQQSLKVWDDSAGTITETTFGGTYVVPSNWSATPRHSDGHIFGFFWTAGSGVSGDYECWEINGASSITQRTDIRTADTNGFQSGCMIDNNTGRLYAVWCSNSAAGVVNYKTSDDGGVTWSGTTQFSAGAHTLRRVDSAISIRTGDTGKWMPIWYDKGPDDFETNDANDIEIAAVSNAVGDYWVIDSAQAKPTSSAPSAILRESDTRDTWYLDTDSAWKLFARWNGAKGGDVTGAATITLDEDYTYFDIAGAVNIDYITIGDWEPGDEFTLQFDGAPTVNHNSGAPVAGVSAAILLSGAANFGATADDVLTLIWDGSTFREKSRTVI